MCSHHSSAKFPAQTWFYIFLITHVLVWTLVPSLIRENLPLDAMEGTTWGHQLEWGYDKNPFLNAWLTALAVFIGGTSGWTIYLFCQLSVAACLYAVWQLANRMLAPTYALIAVMMLEGVQYFNFHALDFNDNTLELGTWGLATYFFYKALRTPTYRAWILTAIFLGLGMMAKYYTAALVAAMALFLLFNSQSRRQLATLPPYMGLCVFSLIILPHFIWLFYHDFISVKYVFGRTSSEPHWSNHLFYPAQFAWQQLQVFLPAALLYLILFIPGKKNQTTIKAEMEPAQTVADKHFNLSFLFFVCLGPFLLTLLLSLCLGIKLRAGWGMPLLSFFGLILIMLKAPPLTRNKLCGFITTIFVALLIMAIAYSYSQLKSSSSANYPGREITRVVTQMWEDKYHAPLKYVAGSRWLAGNISFYSPQHPAVFIEWNLNTAPWIDIVAMKKSGAIFVWEIERDVLLFQNIKAAYPNLEQPIVLQFHWLRNKDLKPIQIGVTFLPPQPTR